MPPFILRPQNKRSHKVTSYKSKELHYILRDAGNIIPSYEMANWWTSTLPPPISHLSTSPGHQKPTMRDSLYLIPNVSSVCEFAQFIFYRWWLIGPRTSRSKHRNDKCLRNIKTSTWQKFLKNYRGLNLRGPASRKLAGPPGADGTRQTSNHHGRQMDEPNSCAPALCGGLSHRWTDQGRIRKKISF